MGVAELEDVELLILGAGWTSTFLIPLLEKEGILFAATTTDGRDGTIPFRFDPASNDEVPFQRLPTARTVLVTFPLKGKGPSAQLAKLYAAAHPGSAPRYVQLGSTGLWTGDGWTDDDSPYDTSNDRGIAEDELRGLGGAVLNLAGLYGGARQPGNWVDRVIKSREALRTKGCLHLVHGADVARAIVGLHRNFTPGKRWMLTDMHVYDWWDIVQDVAARKLQDVALAADAAVVARQEELLAWLRELMAEEGVRALPRELGLSTRQLDGRGFWTHVGLWPLQGRAKMDF